jgi:energy-converting hydrogenase Eha subunit B
MGMAQDSSSNSTLTYANSRDARTAGSRRWYYLLVVFVLAALPRLWQLDYFLMVDENLWYQRSAHFLQGLVSGNLAQTVQSGHPGVTAMWSGAIGLLLHYAQSALPGETLVQFAARMTTTPATLATLQLLRLPLALLSALVVVLAFGLGRRLLGTGAALAGAALMAFEPLYLAHCRVLHHDSPAAGFSLLAVLGWLLYLKERRHRYLLLAGLGIGLAVLSKVSSVFLLGFAGLTLLPVAWRERRQWLSAVRAVAVPWLKLAGIVCLVMVLVWPALWAAPGTTLNTVLGFIAHEKGAHASGTFFMGQPVPDAGPLYYPVSLAFALTPLTLVGLALAVISLGLVWVRVRRFGVPAVKSDQRWATWLLVYVILFIVFMSLIGKKQERYVLPAVVVIDMLAGWGWTRIRYQISNGKYQMANVKSQIAVLKWPALSLSLVLVALLAVGQAVFAWRTAPYYSTFYNPLLGGAAQAQKVTLIGRGEGLERAVRYVQDQSGDQVPRVSSWYGTTVTILFGGEVDVSDVSHPQYLLRSDYIIFYINQLQRQLPRDSIIRYVTRDAPLYTARLAGIDYAYVYQGKAIAHPVDPFATQNRLVGRANLAGFEMLEAPATGARVPVRLYWVNDGMRPGDHFYVRLTDTLGQDWAWGPCNPDSTFGDAAVWQDDDIIESQCQLVVYPGTPPGEYLLRAGVIGEDGMVVGQIELSPAEGTVVVGHPPAFPEDEWVPVEHRVEEALNDSLALVGYDYTPAVRKPGESVPLTLYWRALEAIAEDYAIAVTLQGDGPGQHAEWINQPVNGRYPTPGWQMDELVRDPWTLHLPASLPTGEYNLIVTLLDVQGSQVGQLMLSSLTVEGRDHLFTLAQPPSVAQSARLGEDIRLLGYDLDGGVIGQTLVPGQDLAITITWQAEATPQQNYVVFVQLLDAANQVQAQHDDQPGDGALITATWAPGEYVGDTHRLSLPADLPSGEYRLIVGMYLPDSGERLAVFDEAGQSIGNDLTLSTPLHVP